MVLSGIQSVPSQKVRLDTRVSNTSPSQRVCGFSGCEDRSWLFIVMCFASYFFRIAKCYVFAGFSRVWMGRAQGCLSGQEVVLLFRSPFQRSFCETMTGAFTQVFLGGKQKLHFFGSLTGGACQFTRSQSDWQPGSRNEFMCACVCVCVCQISMPRPSSSLLVMTFWGVLLHVLFQKLSQVAGAIWCSRIRYHPESPE